MKAKILVYALPALILTTIHLAEAQQQSTKIPRIGYLMASVLSYPGAAKHSGKDCASLGMWRGRTSSLSGDPERESGPTTWPRRRAGSSQGRCHRHGWVGINPCRQASNFYDSHCHDAGCRSGWDRDCRQPCATWRKHYRTVQPPPGVKRKTTGASEGDRSPALSCGRLRDFNHPGRRASVTRDGTRRRGARVKLQYLDVLSSNDFETAFRKASKERADAVLMMVAGSVVSTAHTLSNSPQRTGFR